MEGAEIKQETPATSQPAATKRRNWNPLATPKRMLLSILVMVVLSAGVFVGVRALQPPQTPTGHVKWLRQVGTMWHSAPTVSNGVLYIGTSENKVIAFQATSGQVIWSVQLGHYTDTDGDPSTGTSTGIVPAPVVNEGMVYANSQNGFIYALDANTGNTLWSYKGYSMMAPAVANGIVYVGTEEGVLLALDAASGHLRWSQQSRVLFTFFLASPAIAQGLVYAPTSNGVAALDAVSGQVRWATSSIDVQYTPTVANGVVYLTSIQGYFSALDASTGKVLWSFFSAHCCGFASPPVVIGQHIYISSIGGVLTLDANTHRERWFPQRNGIFSTPTIVNNTIYVIAGDRNWKPQPNSLDLGPDDHELDVLNATTGSDLWYYPISGLVFSTPAVSNGITYVGAQDGTLYALLPPG